MLDGLKQWMRHRTLKKRMESAKQLSQRLSRINPTGSEVMDRIAQHYEDELLILNIQSRKS